MKHGPYGRQGAGEPSSSSKHVRIVGLGQTGIAVADQIMLRASGAIDLWALDTDTQTVEGSVAPEKQVIGIDQVHGLGCSGDASLAQEAVEADHPLLKQIVEGCDYLIITAGLGGGTGTVLAETLVRDARAAGTPVLAAVCLPFSFESRLRLRRALESVQALRESADAVLVFANDRSTALAPNAANLRHSFHQTDRLMAAAVEALALGLQAQGLIPLTFGDVRSLFGRFVGTEALENAWCAAAEVRMDSEEGEPDALVASALDSVIFSQETFWPQVDQVLAIVSGDRETSVSDVQAIAQALKRQLPASAPVTVAASTRAKADGKLRLTLLAANTTHAAQLPEAFARAWAGKGPARATAPLPPVEADGQLAIPLEPAKSSPQAPAPALTHEELALVPGASTQQEELPLGAQTRGRFERSPETIYKGEDLDVPTFRRRRIPVRC